MLRWLIGIILGKIICKSSNWQHVQRLKITILGANWQLFRLEMIAKCSYFILSTQNIKFWLICNKNNEICVANLMKNRAFILLRVNLYFGIFILNGINSFSGLAYFKITLNLPHSDSKEVRGRFVISRVRNAALLKKLMKIHSNPPILYYGFKTKLGDA